MHYDFGISGINAGSTFGIIILILTLLFVIFKPDYTLDIDILKPLYFFLALSTLSLINSNNIFLFASHFFKYTATICLLVIPYNLVKNIDQGIKALKCYVIISVPIMLYGFFQLITGTGSHSKVHADVFFNKIMSTFAHPNNYSFYLGLIVFSLFILCRIEQQRTTKALWFTLLISSVVSILFTYSRSVWLSVVVCSIIVFLKNKSMRLPLVLISLTLFCLFSSLISNRFEDLLHKRNDGGFNSLEFRVKMSKSLFNEAFPLHPIVGFGLGSSRAVAKKYAGMDTVPHNDYMRVLIETGITGFCGFMLFVVSILRFIIRHIRYLECNIFYTGIVLMTLYFIGIMCGTNQLGSFSTSGMWFCLLGILLKLFELTTNTPWIMRKYP